VRPGGEAGPGAGHRALTRGADREGYALVIEADVCGGEEVGGPRKHIRPVVPAAREMVPEELGQRDLDPV
jgi:hypothetical protein